MRRLTLYALLLAPLALGTAHAGEGGTLTYYAGFCVENGGFLCGFDRPSGSTEAYVRVADSVAGEVCFNLQWVLENGDYAYDWGAYGSGTFAAPPSAVRVNVYADWSNSLDCALNGRIRPATTGSITVEWR